MGPRSKPGRDLQSRAIDIPRLTLNDIAKGVGMSRSSLTGYRLKLGNENRVTMPSAVALRLASFLRDHARELKAIADDLQEHARRT